MVRKLLVKDPIYPLIGIISAILIVVAGLLTAKNKYCIILLAAIWLLFMCFGYWRACLAVIPVAALFCLILGGITFLISRSWPAALAAVCRILALCVAVIPGLAMPPVSLVRCFESIRMPRMLTLAMMITLNFFPLLATEVRRVREAMKTRGALSIWNPQVFYRALIIPLMMRLINISDTLALSVETRGFTSEGDYTVYRDIRISGKDILFAALLLLLIILAMFAFYGNK